MKDPKEYKEPKEPNKLKKPWFERTFSFDLPAWMFPNLVERLRGTPARLEDQLLDLDRAELIEKSGEAWSIQENVGHLGDLEPLWLGRLQDIQNGRETLRPADLTNQMTRQADHNRDDIFRLLGRFRTARRSLVVELDELEEEAVERFALHPRLGSRVRVLDLAFVIAEHDDHHLAEITRLIRRSSRDEEA
jgi:uncharacterized damage-inducible protein DinB